MAGEAEIRLRERLSRLRSLPLLRGARLSGELERLERQLERIEGGETDEDIWRSVELARHPERPYALDYVERMLEDFVELHGDRARAEDPAVVTGLGRFGGRTVAFIGHQKSDPPRGARERQRRNFGMTYPEGYRKAMRTMEIAERHGFPLICLVDTPGAYPGVAAEQHGQGGAIARSQALLARLSVPTVACIIGEGGSGGAMAIALADRVLMQENAIYTVISPEGCAAILWRDGAEKVKAAAALKPDALHCLQLGAIDLIVPEPAGGAHTDYDEAARLLAEALRASLDELGEVPGEQLRRRRRDRFRSLGIYGAHAGAKSAAQPRS
jgi:acetyl-CoA carboxylase carboxyl transferase subunit alpha